ncbi:MAG: HIT family protein [Candidatus Nomurabacteria bacterium]|jgi:histidine triad (HIT) family protein|nr:HIT family protein [Candidatus Nomurabacteria bacterium]
MTDSVFTKIIRGEIPAHFIYQDDKVVAFLDNHPVSPGHTLVVSRIQVDKFYDLPDDDYRALFAAVKKLAAHLDKIFDRRTLVKIIGTDVPHCHIHLMPWDPNFDKNREPVAATDDDLAAMAERLRFS